MSPGKSSSPVLLFVVVINKSWILYQLDNLRFSVAFSARYGRHLRRDTVQLEPAVSTISQEYLLEFTSEYGISEDLYPKLPGPEERIVDFSEGKNNRFFWVDKRVFPTVANWRTSAPKDEMPAEDTYSPEAVTVLNTHRTPIQKHPEALLCLVGLSRRYFLGDDVYPTFLQRPIFIRSYQQLFLIADMDLFNLIHAPNPTKAMTGTRPHAAHEVPFLTVTASQVIEMEDSAASTDSSRAALAEEIASIVPRAIKEHCKRGNDGVDMNAPPKVLRRDHSDSQPTHSTIGGKSLAVMGLGMGSTCHVPMSRDTPVDVSDSDPLSFASPLSIPTENVAQSFKGAANAGDPELENTSFTSMAIKNKIRNLEALLEAETNMKKTAEAKNAELRKELENLRALFSNLQLSNDRLSQQVSTLQAQVTGEEKLKAVFEEFKKYENDRVEKRCRRWVVGYGLRLAVMNCCELTKLRQMESLKDAPIDVIMASLHLESDTGDDAPQGIRELCPSSSQLKILVYQEVRDHKDPWAFKEDILLADAIAINVSRAEKKNKF
uniref:Transposase (Putative), gypsy type n=1 Tax=Tanacetum cinerariifolium TaxID=118510 RepID=A0A699HJ40_TANCI|nr:hypothetical protein [Tanacetum cinerariifolium]